MADTPTSREPTVLAVVLNYNGRELTLQSLASLSRLDYGNVDLLVVDNGSTDGSLEAVGERFPGVETLRTEQNLGPAGGLNLGIRRGLEADYDYLLLLNNDIEVDPRMLSELVAVAEGDPTIGCVGPKIYYYERRDRLWSAGGRIRFREAVTRERGMNEVDRGQFERTEEVDYINGCAMLVRTPVMREVGLWDPIYHLGVEDADWCVRMKRCGYRCYYAHRALLWHMVAFTTGVYSPGKTFHTGRSTAIFVRRHGTGRQRLSFALWFLASIPVAFLRELAKGNSAAVVAKVRGVVEGLRVELPPSPPAEA